MKVYLILLILPLLCFGVLLHGQKKITTLSGQKIIFKDDGSWVKSDYLGFKEDTTGMLTSDLNPLKAPVQEKFLLDDKHQQGIALLLSEAEKKEIEYFILIDQIEKEIDAKGVLLSHSRQSNNKESEARVIAEVSDLKSKLKTSNKLYSIASNQISLVKNLRYQHPDKREENMLSLGKSLNIDMKPYIISSALDPHSLSKSTSGSGAISRICKIAKDEKSDKGRVIEMQNDPFFNFTPEKLKNYFKSKELMQVNVHLEKNNKSYFLHFQVKIHSKDAAKNYGIIDKESLCRIQFISGKNIHLKSGNEAFSNLENYSGSNVYEIYYALDNEQLKMLQNNPIDTVGIMWSSGFETYDIYNVDVIMNQIDCLKSL